MSKQLNNKENQSFLSIALSSDVVLRSAKVAIIVGTLLACINHGEKILELSLTSQDLFKVILTYLVPYGVSTWSSVLAIKASARMINEQSKY